MMSNQTQAKVIYDRVVIFEKPGGTRYTTFLFKGDIVTIIDGYRYDDRSWKDKKFVKVRCPNGEEGYMSAQALQEVRPR